MKKLKSTFSAACFLMAVLSSSASIAQGISSRDSDYLQSFVDNVTKSCIANPGELDARQVKPFCGCYANAFASRFSPDQLRLLAGLAARSSDARLAVRVAMEPDRSSCLRGISDPPAR